MEAYDLSIGKIDSYKVFLEAFDIDKEKFFKWGIDSIIFPPVDKVESEWVELKDRIFNDKTVYIRGYGREGKGTNLYKDFYILLLNNNHVEKDPTNNAEPKKVIERITGLRRNFNLYNYQISHIWGHTKNVFMFLAPWNICYTPKIIDPFTGHESKGDWPKEFQILLLEKARDLYGPYINEYNSIIEKLEIHNKLDKYIENLEYKISEKDLLQFKKDALNEFAKIN